MAASLFEKAPPPALSARRARWRRACLSDDASCPSRRQDYIDDAGPRFADDRQSRFFNDDDDTAPLSVVQEHPQQQVRTSQQVPGR